MSQTETILKHLRTRGSITPLEALTEYGCMRLGARVYDLKRMGHRITAERMDYVTEHGVRKHYAKYRMEDENGA